MNFNKLLANNNENENINNLLNNNVFGKKNNNNNFFKNAQTTKNFFTKNDYHVDEALNILNKNRGVPIQVTDPTLIMFNATVNNGGSLVVLYKLYATLATDDG